MDEKPINNINPDQIILSGPFAQLLTMDKLPLRGSLYDDQLEIIPDAGIVHCDGVILALGRYSDMKLAYPQAKTVYFEKKGVCLPGLIDAHTHICYAGSRASDFAARLAGKSYQEIAKNGGGIWDTVTKTRDADIDLLIANTVERADKLYQQGVRTIEVKSGYGLTVDQELKMLEAIKRANELCRPELVSTCLAAHIVPKEFAGAEMEYMEVITGKLLSEIQQRGLSKRVDIFVEEGAFSLSSAEKYLLNAREQGFDIVLHGDQFGVGAAGLAVKTGALSIDHLEAADDEEIKIIAQSDCIPVALPGASLGLGAPFAPARRILDAGCSLVIASDLNPGSAPMGQLILQTSVLAVFEKLSMAECLAAITIRAAKALNKNDRGILRPGMKADFAVFDCMDYREILYQQGNIKTLI